MRYVCETTRIRIDKLDKTFSVTNCHYISQILFRNLPPYLQNFNNYKLFTYKKKVQNWLIEIGREATEALVTSGYR